MTAGCGRRFIYGKNAGHTKVFRGSAGAGVWNSLTTAWTNMGPAEGAICGVRTLYAAYYNAKPKPRMDRRHIRNKGGVKIQSYLRGFSNKPRSYSTSKATSNRILLKILNDFCVENGMHLCKGDGQDPILCLRPSSSFGLPLCTLHECKSTQV